MDFKSAARIYEALRDMVAPPNARRRAAGSREWQPIESGYAAQPGDLIETRGSGIDVTMDGQRMPIRPNSMVPFEGRPAARPAQMAPRRIVSGTADFSRRR